MRFLIGVLALMLWLVCLISVGAIIEGEANFWVCAALFVSSCWAAKALSGKFMNGGINGEKLF